MTDLPRVYTRIGGPWVRRTAAAETPHLPHLFQDPLPSKDELSDEYMVALCAVAAKDADTMAALTGSEVYMAALVALVQRMAAALVAQDTLITLQRITTARHMTAAEAEVLRLQRLHAERCSELDATRRTLADLVAHTAIRDGAAALGCRCPTERDIVPPALTSFDDTDVVDEYDLARQPRTRMDQVITMSELVERKP